MSATSPAPPTPAHGSARTPTGVPASHWDLTLPSRLCLSRLLRRGL